MRRKGPSEIGTVCVRTEAAIPGAGYLCSSARSRHLSYQEDRYPGFLKARGTRFAKADGQGLLRRVSSGWRTKDVAMNFLLR